MASSRPLNVLFLCTGNSARSILAEGILGAVGAGRFKAYSAGSHPIGKVSPFAIELLQKNRLPTDELRSKSWDGFSASDAPKLDFVFTLCDKLTSAPHPAWSGAPMMSHWSVPDPELVEGREDERRKAFFGVYNQLFHRLMILVNLPLEKLDRKALKQRLDDIGND